ncbi:MAG: hypothetical protein K5905_12005 [Roseibium sp.]|uniref:hypothetical protein n=1 Tax=Roseibium sp. TaxID=1936156 RepID=UPI002620A774|nr:hypothetical protein [Roseibium sp.]MCV0426190.1 hypothetical protein [Roseibium sp.]
MSGQADIFAAISAQLQEIRQNQTRDQDNASESRRRVHERLDEQTKALHALELQIAALAQRQDTMEEAFAAASPTLSEFTRTKLRIAGAGMLGAALWKVGAGLLAAAYGVYAWRAEIWAVLTKLMAR